MIPFPDKKYNIIYADPPWSYSDKAFNGNRGAICKYPVMSLEEIKSLPVKSIAADDCVLFIWVTMPKLNEVFEVISAWGFEYKTCAFNWTKMNKNSYKPFIGMGRWTRANNELCLLGTRGNPKRINANVHMLIETLEDDEKIDVLHSRIREHSRKPDEVRKRIVELCGDLPRIELFARESTPGWDTWGNDVEKFNSQDNHKRLLIYLDR